MPADALPPDDRRVDVPWATTSSSPTVDGLTADLLLALTHDLRSPLATVIHAADLLASGRLAPDSDEWRRALALLIQSAGDLQRTNDDLLQLERVARVGEGESLTVDELDVADVAREAQAATHARDREVHLEHASTRARVNRTLLRHLLEALLDNAAVHTPPDADIGIDAARNGDRLLLAVWDTGPGVPDGDKDAVFLPFRRGSGATVEGVGVGLHLVTRFAATLGGRAWVEDQPGGGARFCVDVAVAP